jgi:hypothetical protein
MGLNDDHSILCSEINTSEIVRDKRKVCKLSMNIEQFSVRTESQNRYFVIFYCIMNFVKNKKRTEKNKF